MSLGPEYDVIPMTVVLKLLQYLCPDCQARARTLLTSPYKAERIVCNQRDISDVISAVSSSLGVPAERILASGNHHDAVRARRQIAIALRERGYSFPEIGRAIRRHHSTVMYLIKNRSIENDRPTI